MKLSKSDKIIIAAAAYVGIAMATFSFCLMHGYTIPIALFSAFIWPAFWVFLIG